jgi:peptidyl-prolyl cis-trans isomerase C
MNNHECSRFSGTNLAAAFTAIMLVAPVAHAEVIATVNGTDIEQSTFEFYVESRTQKPLLEATAEEREIVLNELKNIYALSTQPRAAELATDQRFQAQLELQNRSAIAQAVATDWLASNPATEEEIKAAYDSQALLAPDLQFKARHILVETQSAAVELITQLDAGASFEQLAESHSTGPSGPAGGDLGWFSPNQMVAPFSDAVSALTDGAYTKSPVQTEFGWHVIRREESRANEPPPLESVRDSVKTAVEQTKFKDYLDGLRAADAE